MSSQPKPIYLLADSQLLFLRTNGSLYLDSIRNLIEVASPKAAYIGASNGDRPEFYSIFEAAMAGMNIRDCCMVSSCFSSEEALSLTTADLILLAGGDVIRGWRLFEQTGLKDLIVKRYYEGALLIGVSAGAVQLGLLGWPDEGFSPDCVIDLFGLVPYIMSAHDEEMEWEELKSAVQLLGGKFVGIGLPTGGGAIYHPDQSLTPIRHPLHEFSMRDEKLTHTSLVPSSLETK
jgi:peptidase E